MPARSNLFQRLVFEIHRDFGEGWNVQESRSLPDSITRSLREVDVVAESTIGGHRRLIGIEVRDKQRIADVTWVEGLAMKHEHLPTSELVLWSSSGFTKDALTKARALNIETVMPGAAEDAPWSSLARRVMSATAQLVWSNVRSSVDVRLPDGLQVRWDAPPQMLITLKDRSLFMTVGRLQRAMLDHPHYGPIILNHAPDGPGQYHARYDPPRPCTVTGPGGAVGDLICVFIDIKTRGSHGSVQARSALHQDRVVTLAESKMPDGTLSIVVREPMVGEASVIATHKKDRPTKSVRRRRK